MLVSHFLLIDFSNSGVLANFLSPTAELTMHIEYQLKKQK